MVRTKRAAVLHGQTTLTFAIVGALLPVCTPHSVPICSNPVCVLCRLPPHQPTRADFVGLETQGTVLVGCVHFCTTPLCLSWHAQVPVCGVIHTEPDRPCGGWAWWGNFSPLGSTCTMSVVMLRHDGVIRLTRLTSHTKLCAITHHVHAQGRPRKMVRAAGGIGVDGAISL